MLIMAVLLMAGTTFLTISSTESQIAANERATTQALLIAEAAVRQAIAQLSADSSYAGTGGSAVSIGGGTASITVVAATSQICATNVAKEVTATGVMPVGGGMAQAQVKVVLDKLAYPFRWAVFAAVRDGVVVGSYWDPNRSQWHDRRDKEVWLRLNSVVDVFDSSRGAYGGNNSGLAGGKLGAFGDIWLESGTRIRGGVIAGIGVASSGATIEAFRLQGQTSPFEAFHSLTSPGTAAGALDFPAGNYQINSGTYYYTSVTIADNTSLAPNGQVTIYVTGNVTIGNGVTLGSFPATNLRIVTKSDGRDSDLATFKAGDDFVFHGGLYGRNTDVFLGDRAAVYGSIIGRTVLVGDDSRLHYDQAMAVQSICSGSADPYTIRRGTWREVIP
jgi:hypothetical protein